MSCFEEGFRLTDAPSECSIRSKARIDALFEDSRSICSSTLGEWYTAVSTTTSAHPEDVGTEEQKRVNSAVQARIEAMFASVEAESGTPGECAAAILPVQYMGAAPVGGRVASVRGLQEPLRQLIEHMDNSMCAELEVSRRGLTFRTAETCEKINPFRRIAVWSALRLRCKKLANGEYHHAFLPLVGDDLTVGNEDKHADLYRSMRGLKANVEDYAPIFAVVMRRPGAAKVLECHAFACQTEEDAIAAAATLYRALLTDLESNRRRPRQTNGVGCVSLASVASSVREVSPTSRCSVNNRNFLLPLPPRPPAPHPVRPPRVKKSSVSSNVTETESTKSVTKAAAKTPKRKKKISDIKAEDVLEARGRNESPSSNFTTRCNSLNALAARESACDLTREEERRNLCNKVYCMQREVQPTGKNETKSNDLHSRKLNDYEKVATNGRENGDSHYSFIERRGTVLNDREKDLVYEKSRGSYDLNSEGSKNGLSKREMYIPQSGPNELGNAIKCSDNSNENCDSKGNNGRRMSQEKIYQDHFRDADKIYSIGQEDVYTSVNRSRRPSLSQENVEYARSDRNYASRRKENLENSKNEEYSTPKRISRIETMDKRMNRPQVNDVNETRNECNPRVRRRSRAGSEPPLSRTEKEIHSDKGREHKLKRSQSDLDVERGDLMTRVELPRRGSFLTSGSTRRPNTVLGGTPLGFTELFDEFRNQEGLTSVDDILAAIIDPEGMSFNDLKPLYKEFLLKLAATLTQDELYQRSASIMRRRRRPQRRRSTRRSCLLGRAIKRSVSRLKGGPTEFTSVIFPARRLNDSFGSSSSCDAKNNNRNGRVLGSRLGKRRGSSWRRKKCGAIVHTTSEDSDTCRKLSRSVGAGANRSSSGYVSCSECSYDSESCTCVSADKCYCSLSRRRASPRNLSNVPVVCACDTDSCSESNKCYCARRPPQPTILEQLRQRGIVPSESTLSRCGSPDRIRTSKTNRSHSSSRSLEFLQMGPSPTRGSSDNLALDYDLFSPGRRSQHSTDSEKVLVVSARDPQGRLVYVGGAERDKKSLSRGSCRSSAHHEAFSIKKSAEIAAVFGSDTNRVCRRTSNASSIRSSINLEAGLGYLP